MKDKSWYFSFDAESVGLFGEAFAVGWVIVDQDNNELEQGYLAYPVLLNPEHDEWIIENVLPALPVLPKEEQLSLKDSEWGYRTSYANCVSDYILILTFWTAWTKAKQDYPGIVLVSDCPWPVESGFLHRVQQQIGFGMDESFYPIIDVASARAAAGYDPLATCCRLPSEEPAHDPVNDARQSVRLLLALQDELQGNKSLGLSHGLYGPLLNQDGTELVPDAPTFTVTHSADWAGPTGTHVTYTANQEDPEK